MADKKKESNKNMNIAADSQHFDQIVSIFEQSRNNTVKFINNQMVTAYWLIGREIVQEIQSGKERAEYGGRIIEKLSMKLSGKYGSGFSIANLRNFRQFFEKYSDRLKHYPLGSEFTSIEKRHPLGGEFNKCFSSRLSWPHYRALMRIEKLKQFLFKLGKAYRRKIQLNIALLNPSNSTGLKQIKINYYWLWKRKSRISRE